MSDTIFIDGGTPLGLPAAPSVSSSDGVILAQGGTPGLPGSATIREATLAQIFGGSGLGPFLPLVGGTLTAPGNLTTLGTINAAFYANNNGATTYTFAGAVQSNPVKLVGVINGTNSDGFGHVFSFAIPNDQIVGTPGSALFGLHMSHNMGGGPAAGGRTAGLFSANHTNPIDSTGQSVFLGALAAWFTGTSSITGSGGGGGIAFNPQAFLPLTSSGYKLVETIEGTVGSQVAIASRGFCAAFSAIGFQGSVNDYCYGVFSNPGVGKQQFGMALALGRSEAPWGVSATGSIIGTVVQTNGGGNGAIPQVAAFGVNLPTVNFSTAAWWTPGFQVLGEGTHRIGGGVVAPIATGLSIDVVNFVGGTPTVSVAGLGYAVNDQVYDTNGGVLNVDTIGGSGQITAFHYLRVPYSYGGAGPAAMALSGGSGNLAAVVGVTWTQQRALQTLQTAAGLIGFYGHAPTLLQTGVAVTAAGIHAALVNLGLITA